MKKILRMIIFAGIAIFLTSIWNKGFIVDTSWQIFFKATIIVALIYYIVVPISKVVLLPLNILTLGLVSTIVYFLLFYLFIARYNFIEIKPWMFQGTNISFLVNIILSSLSISVIINALEKLL